MTKQEHDDLMRLRSTLGVALTDAKHAVKSATDAMNNIDHEIAQASIRTMKAEIAAAKHGDSLLAAAKFAVKSNNHRNAIDCGGSSDGCDDCIGLDALAVAILRAEGLAE